jgi:hypothetical protein
LRDDETNKGMEIPLCGVVDVGLFVVTRFAATVKRHISVFSSGQHDRKLSHSHRLCRTVVVAKKTTYS